MIQVGFTRLLSVQVSHDFYESGESSDFIIRPSEECKRVLANLKILFQPTNTGFILATQTVEQINSGTYRPFINMNRPFRLTFYLIVKKSEILTYTDLPIETGQNNIFYLTNRFNKQAPGAPSVLFLSGHSTASNTQVSEEDYVRLVSGRFKYRLSDPDPTAGISVEVRDLLTNDLVWPRPDHFQGEGPVIDCNILRFPDGRYVLSESTGVTQSLYKNDELAVKNPKGVIELFSNSPIPDFQFVEILPDNSAVVHPKTYTISFVSRNSFWRYYLIAKTKDFDIGRVSITNTAPQDFDNTIAVPDNIASLYGAGNVVAWQSRNPFDFKEVPTVNVDYQIQGDDDDETPLPPTTTGTFPFPMFSKALPKKDSSGNILVDANGDPIFFSEQFILF
jgi:hypothetical protein